MRIDNSQDKDNTGQDRTVDPCLITKLAYK